MIGAIHGRNICAVGVAVITWQRPTSWSAETTDGVWYAERLFRNPRKWTLIKLRGRKRGRYGVFRSLKDAAGYANDWRSVSLTKVGKRSVTPARGTC
jgi:hypothetical protein